MNISRDRRRLTSVVLWIPVAVIVAALFLVPSGTEAAARAGSLTIQPGGSHYGGQLLTYSGDVGDGAHQIYLERRGSDAGKWARVPDPRPGPQQGNDFSVETDPNGTFSVQFPSLAMDGCQIRFAGDGVATEVLPCVTVHQDVAVLGPTTATAGAQFTLTGTTATKAKEGRPEFPGRDAELQIRNGAHEWITIAHGTVGGDGKTINNFGPIMNDVVGKAAYRIRLDDWTEDGDVVGWYPSLPFYVTVHP